MTVCVVNGCNNTSNKVNKHSNITFHSFPSDPVVADQWIQKIRLNRNTSWWKPTKHTKICSVHFHDSEKYTTKGGLCRLRRNIVPSKNLPILSTAVCNDCVKNIGCQEQIEPQPGTSSTKDDCATLKSPSVSVSSSIFDTPKRASMRGQLRRKILIQQKLNKKVKNLQQRNRRLKKRNASLRQILLKLRQERYINNDISNILSENVFAAQLYNNLAKKISKNKKRPMPKYTPEFRKFCLTLHFYSPRAYTYVRNTFNTCLPHPKTIYNWYRSTDGSPGFTDEAFRLLKSKVESSANKKIVCALVADEMSIRPQNLKGGQGRVDMGTGTADCNILATEAYTFLLVCLNEHWKIPLGYFLVHSLSGGKKANLIKMCLTKCEEAGVKVAALTFDGHATNISAMQLLGCKINDPDNMKTSFKHPSATYDVAVFLDPCHMIKLVRNHLEDKKELLDQDDNKIAWDFLTKLVNLQEKEGLHIANKLTRKHLLFRTSVMKVKLASQLLSRSVAVALNFCRKDLKLKDFEGSEGTEKFVLLFNNLFDVFNSRRLIQHGFCHPISNSNKQEIFDFLDEAKKYILNLKIKTTRKRKYKEDVKSIKLKIKSFEPALSVKCSPGFKGLLICIESLKHLFCSLVEDTKEMKYLTTYRISQDHIELLFGCIRLNGGHNDNPNALQFKGSYRKLLCHMEIQAGTTGNCVPLENIGILTCSSALSCINASSFSERFDDADEDVTNLSTTQSEIDGQFEVLFSHDDPNYKNHIIGYIAGNVVRFLSKRVKCEFCIGNMLSTEKMWFHTLVRARDQGGLIYASKEVHALCTAAETCLQKRLKESPGSVHTEKELSLATLKELIGKPLFTATIEHVNYQNHNVNLARLIIERYLRIRLFYEAKKANISRTISSKRQTFRKQLQFQGV